MAFGAPFPGGGLVTGQFNFSGGGQNVRSFSGSFGALDPTRLIIACAGAASNIGLSTLTIGGVAATELISIVNGVVTSSIWGVADSTNLSGTIALSANGPIGVSCYSLYKAKTITPAQVGNANSPPLQATLAGAAGGSFLIAMGFTENSTNSATWSGGPLADTSFVPATGAFMSSASLSKASGLITPLLVFGTNSLPTFACAAWSP